MANQHSEIKDSKSLCILVADDLEVNQVIVQLILQKAGHRVDLAENGQQAVAACKRNRYDLIFMDIQMPIMDGNEATRQIREWEARGQKSEVRGQRSENRGQKSEDRGQREEVEKMGRWEGENKSEIQTPISGIGHSAPGIQGPESSIQDPASHNQRPASSIQHPASSIQYPASSIQYPVSSIQYPVSSIQYPVPIIAMTGNACEGGFNQSKYPGMNDCIGKPIQRDRLLKMVLKWTRPANDKPAVDRPVAESLPDSKKSGKGQLPFDFNRAVQEFMGQIKLLVSVLKEFIENAGIRLEVIQRAVKSNDYDLIAREAHSIKGGAANLTADILAGTAADLERAAVERRTDLTRQLAANLELDLRDLLTFIRGNITGID